MSERSDGLAVFANSFRQADPFTPVLELSGRGPFLVHKRLTGGGHLEAWVYELLWGVLVSLYKRTMLFRRYGWDCFCGSRRFDSTLYAASIDGAAWFLIVCLYHPNIEVVKAHPAGLVGREFDC